MRELSVFQSRKMTSISYPCKTIYPTTTFGLDLQIGKRTLLSIYLPAASLFNDRS